VFQQQWWLDAVTGGQFGEVTVKADNTVVGWLPYFARRRWGFDVSPMPFLTHTLGPVITPGTGNAVNEFLRYNSITRQLLEKLPKLDHFRQVLPPGDSSALGFIEYGCHVRVQFTFIADCSDLDGAWTSMRDKTRNLIRRAEEQNPVDAAGDLDEFLRFYADNCRTRGKVNHYDDPRTRIALSQAQARDQCRIYLYRNRATRAVDAGIVVVWDSRYMYFLLSARRADAHSGAVSLLLWHAMREAQSRGIAMDFDGVISTGTYRFLSGFGGRLAHRHVAEKFNPLYHALDRIRASFTGSMDDPYTT
jgi:lipid II:glycine glycyltransferase (peptidoglycan interpeptide bridge formation enzyme)